MRKMRDRYLEGGLHGTVKCLLQGIYTTTYSMSCRKELLLSSLIFVRPFRIETAGGEYRRFRKGRRQPSK